MRFLLPVEHFINYLSRSTDALSLRISTYSLIRSSLRIHAILYGLRSVYICAKSLLILSRVMLTAIRKVLNHGRIHRVDKSEHAVCKSVERIPDKIMGSK